jgi:hypothetical protein
LGSTSAILARSFCNTSIVTDKNEIRTIFENGLKEIRAFEEECRLKSDWFWRNHDRMCEEILHIVNTLKG